MQFLMTVRGDPRQPGPTPELMSAIGKLTEKSMKAGTMLQTGGMADDGNVTCFSLSGGRISPTDGPYAEAKEQVGGYALVEVSSREEALEMAREFLAVHAEVMGPDYTLSTEIREMFPFAGIGIKAKVPPA